MNLEDLPRVSTALPWHAAQWAALHEQDSSGQLPHALLLTGPAHTGKALFALALARRLLCASPRDGLNCGECRGCEFTRTGVHGDFAWLEPAEGKKVITVDAVRSAIAFATTTAGYGERKVLVFAPADSMNINAANALLKCLEEPADNTYLILVCHRIAGVPATIRSRCQIRRLPAPSAEASQAWLQQVTGDAESAARMLLLADRQPLRARDLWLGGDSDDVEQRFMALRGMFEGKLPPPVVAAAWAGEEPEAFVAHLAGQLQAVLRGQSADALRSARGRQLFSVLDELNRLQAATEAGANPNKQLVVDAMLAKLHSVLSSPSVG